VTALGTAWATVAAGLVAGLAVALLLTVRHQRRAAERLGTTASLLAAASGVSTPATPTADLDEAVARVERVADRFADGGTSGPVAEERLARALSVIPQGVVIFDADGEVTFSNQPAEHFLAARHGEALVEEAIVQLAEEALRGTSATRTVDLFGPPRRSLELRSVPLDHGRRSVGAVVSIDDVSERRRLEAVRRDFVANISHELKTPIGALGLLAETLLGEDDPAVVERLSARMVDEAHRVGRTIDDLLELSRIEAEEEARRMPVPVHECIDEAVARVRAAADNHGIALAVDTIDPRLAVLGDRRQLVSAVYNLLENAVKYSDPGSAVEVRARTNGTWVDVAVEDHGIGIPRRDLERVFERFYRVDRGRSRETGGTGLGLAIVRHVAGNHQGEVRVESQEGAGSTFTLRLPAGPGPVAVTAEAG
jgi:two-component system, OmpR family, sensor histidine kinase SenX3